MIRWMVVMFLMIAPVSFAEDAGKSAYSESFKKGATKITEQTLDVALTPEHATQDFRILDAFGKPRYTLRFVPDIPTGDTRIVGWFVRLEDARHKIYSSLLPANLDLSQDRQQLWWLDAKPYAKTNLQTPRIFKVEQFYLVIQVKDVKRLIPDRPYVNQMTVAVQFTNTRP